MKLESRIALYNVMTIPSGIFEFMAIRKPINIQYNLTLLAISFIILFVLLGFILQKRIFDRVINRDYSK